MEKKEFVVILALVLVIGLLAGVVGGVLSAQLFITTGPQGETGPEGPEGPQGLPGFPGLNGTNSILQVMQTTNATPIDTGSYTAMQWYNLSLLDSAMNVTIDVQQDSRVLAQFSGTHTLEPPAAIWVRIVLDHDANSSTYICSTGPPASGVYKMTGHIDFLTESLNAGPHTITVQFLRENGSPTILDRTFTVIELASQ